MEIKIQTLVLICMNMLSAMSSLRSFCETNQNI